jgi:hypothetical protein
VAAGELFLGFGFAADGALVKGLVEADLLACVAEQLWAGGQATGSVAREWVTQGVVVDGIHEGRMPEALAPR